MGDGPMPEDARVERTPREAIHPGAHFENLDVGDIIGQGAFSTVYRCQHRLLGRSVALKALDPASSEDRAASADLLLSEARMVAQLTGPHVVMLYAVHPLADGLWAFEMEYMAGGDLNHYIEEVGALPLEEALDTVRSVLRGLVEAHAAGIVHRDVKPGNVLLGAHGEVKLSDFGLGLLIKDEDLSRYRRVGGTPYYMAPEVFMGGEATVATDLWSVGILLHRLAEGEHPFPVSGIERLFGAIVNDAPAPMKRSIPSYIRETVLACLAKDPTLRPPSAAAVLERLDRSAHPGPARGGRAVPAGEGVIVGRVRERAALATLLDEVAESQCRVASITGEAGVGKTALLTALGADARARGFQWIAAAVTPIDGLSRPLLAAIRSALTADGNIDASSLPDELRPGVIEEIPSPGKMRWVVEAGLRRLLDRGPAVLAIEDLHVADPEDFALLSTIHRQLDGSRLLLVLTWRSSRPGSSHGSPQTAQSYYDFISYADVETVKLRPLTRDALRELLHERFGASYISDDILARVFEVSDGVPLYAVEVLAHLLNAGEVDSLAGQLRAGQRWGRTALPQRLHDLVAQRVHDLDPNDRALLETAAVAGPAFDGRELAEITDTPLLDLLRRLQRLYRERGVVVPSDRGFRFEHGLYQEALYEGLAPALRRVLHEAWANALEARPAADAVEPDLLGWHWERAGRLDRARAPMLQAAKNATQRGEKRRALDLAERAGLLDPHAPPETLRDAQGVLLALAPTYASATEADRVEALHDRLAAAASALGDADMASAVLVAGSWHRHFRHGDDEIDEDALLRAAQTLPFNATRGEAWWLLVRLALARGDRAEAEKRLEDFDATTARSKRPYHKAVGSAFRAEFAAKDGDLEGAARLYDEAAQLNQAVFSPQNAAVCRINALLWGSRAGDRSGTADAMVEPIRDMERAGQDARAASATVIMGEMLESEGRVRELWKAVEHAEPVLAVGVLKEALRDLRFLQARAHFACGSLREAGTALAAVAALVGEGDAEARAQMKLRQAALELVQGGFPEAGELLDEALDLFPQLDSPPGRAWFLREVAALHVLGLDASDSLKALAAALPDPESAPPCLALAVRLVGPAVAGGVGVEDRIRVLRAAAEAAHDARNAWLAAETEVLGQFLEANAEELASRPDVARELLGAAVEGARRIEHVWLELTGLERLHDLGVDSAQDRARELCRGLAHRKSADSCLLRALRERWDWS